jgi:hypothetical protein
MLAKSKKSGTNGNIRIKPILKLMGALPFFKGINSGGNLFRLC